MTIEEIKELDNCIIDLKTLEEVEASENVVAVTDNGMSGLHYNKHWYSVELVDGEEIQLYV